MLPSPAPRGDRYRPLPANSTGQAGESEQPPIKLWRPEAGGAQQAATARGHRYWPTAVLGVIVLGALSLTTAWVFLVPIDQAPDEPGHWDYALCLWEHGGIIELRPARPRTTSQAP